MRQDELRLKETLTPSELKRFGKKAKIFSPEKNDRAGVLRTQTKSGQYAGNNNGVVYSGIHSENDWSRTKFWSKGWHFANRTGEYAVVLPKFEIGKEKICGDCMKDKDFCPDCCDGDSYKSPDQIDPRER
jgi:hypothetical protein